MKPPQRLKLWIAYDGRGFRGWQSQATRDAVQDHLEAALEKICGRRVPLHGAGRTDAGVHALRQCAHIELPPGSLPVGKWTAALNANLPAEIRVLSASRAPASFHARFSARGKTYVYRIWNAPILSPFERGRAWHFPSPLDLRILRDCAAKFVGEHDFAGFAANRGAPVTDTVRTIHAITLRQRGALLDLRFEGTGFLYKMVRLLTGSLVRCAQGRAEPGWIDGLLLGRGKIKSSFAAPADGLYLVRVKY